jgi:putative phosphoribosyl transferase
MEKIIHVEHSKGKMEGMLKLPANCQGIVLFAHGSGSSRFSPRNNFVADFLNEGGLATLLIDLLSKEEDSVYATRFDIDLLTDRLSKVVAWLQATQETLQLPIGLFGSSTGAAAALQVASKLGNAIEAVVSRGGRPDLAMGSLRRVTAPSLFIVGGADFGVIELNEKAFQELGCKKQFEVIPNATHLFEEPGCLEEVAKVAREWFQRHLGTRK